MEILEKKYMWLWLARFSKVTKSKIIKLIKEFETIDNIFSADRKDYERLPFLKEEEIESLSYKNLEEAKKIVGEIKKDNPSTKDLLGE